ncbi:alkylmercury lyase family protein [Haloechinothrix sp. LS1_15]|uniref:alkylmercury lyase family protein n=1 Tax=Haloechinothrix sp. LS1_15 TaxID=2652248 RepID=UPI00294865EA|nr:alkylmercury lyase family protein [Haloechinothrix sp. LS1_15]MDV6013605.1 hypothetical protein [Haloechinothrix sp. LS1_15]
MTGTPHPEPNTSRAAAALTPEARGVHRALLSGFAATGQSLTREDLERVAHRHGTDVATVVTELAEADVVAFGERGEVRAAYPFAPVPTPISVTWRGGPAAYAMCAIDALGISAMLDRAVTITACEPRTGKRITVDVDNDQASWHPDSAVVFAGTVNDTCCAAVDRMCGYVNFFTSARAASDWASDHPDVRGAVLDQATALASGIAEFGELLRM